MASMSLLASMALLVAKIVGDLEEDDDNKNDRRVQLYNNNNPLSSKYFTLYAG
jgi:hypothetical protein